MAEDPQTLLAYEESRRGLARQEQRLDEVRARAATLLTAASISAAFLAGSLLRGTELEPLTWAGLSAYVLVSAIVACLLLPATGWTFTLDGRWILNQTGETGAESEDALRRVLVDRIEGYYFANEKKLKRRTAWLSVACIGLMLELLFFLSDLKGA